MAGAREEPCRCRLTSSRRRCRSFARGSTSRRLTLVSRRDRLLSHNITEEITLADTTHRGRRTVTFPEANYDEEHVAAVLITRDAAGNHRAYVKDIPGKTQPDPEIVALLAQSAEIANL